MLKCEKCAEVLAGATERRGGRVSCEHLGNHGPPFINESKCSMAVDANSQWNFRSMGRTLRIMAHGGCQIERGAQLLNSCKRGGASCSEAIACSKAFDTM